MQCDGQPHVLGPFDGRQFCHDLIRELRRLAGGKGPPAFPERLWFRALAIADERDRLRFASELNSRDDDTYFQKQHICSFAATTLVQAGFSAAAIHRTPAGSIRLAPEIHEFKTPEEMRGNWQKRKAERERITAAAANGNGEHAS